MVTDISADVESDNEEREKNRLIGLYGPSDVWNTDELRRDFEVTSFCAPFCMVRRRVDGVKGSVQFQPSPRFYFRFSA